MIVTIGAAIRRPGIGLGSFADITTKACTGIDDDGGVHFTVNLTADEKRRVQVRCLTTDATAETLLVQAWAAYQANVAYLALALPTPVQVTAQVAELTRQVQALIRLVAPTEGA